MGFKCSTLLWAELVIVTFVLVLSYGAGGTEEILVLCYVKGWLHVLFLGSVLIFQDIL